ncbi:MAG: hypothetical protein QM723_11565 [Myxococcaceae bacterium]
MGAALALALIGAGLFRPRSSTAALKCVESSTAGSLEVTDFADAWGSKPLVHLTLVWNLSAGSKAIDASRRQREIAATLVSALDEEPSTPDALPIGGARLTATCDGVVQAVEVYAPNGPRHLWDCTRMPQPVACARIWLRDRYRGARPGAQAVIDKANQFY